MHRFNCGEKMSVAIVVNSCDAYSDLWDIFLLCMSEYWGNCNYQIVLNTESKNYSIQDEINFDVLTHHYSSGGKDLWGARLISTLLDINAEFVIVLYDDFLLNSQVNQDRLDELIHLMSVNSRIGVIYLTKLLGVEKGKSWGNDLAEVAPYADYRLNSSPAIWRKDTLLSFTGKKDNPWAWEYFGSYRTFRASSVFLAIDDSGVDAYPYDYRKGGAIYRGKWVLEVIEPIIERHKLTIDTAVRGVVDSTSNPKRDIAWKVSFLAIGFQMIGFRLLEVIFRVSRRKFLKFVRRLSDI